MKDAPQAREVWGEKVLQFALEQEDAALLDMILKARFDVNASSYTIEYGMMSILGIAIAKYGGHNLDTIKKLISAGGNVNSIVSETSRTRSDTVWPRRTALLQAIHMKSKALVELLIEERADIHRAARLGLKRTPLQYACEVGSIEIVKPLLEKGADFNEEPAVRRGGTSLQLCAIGDYCGIADKLLKQGASIQCNGPTAFDAAAEHGRLYMLMLLWDAGACRAFNIEHWERVKKLAEDNGQIARRGFLKELTLIGQGLITPILQIPPLVLLGERMAD